MTTYFVDSALGVDANPGFPENLAWKTLSRINAADLRPGDRVLLRRGGEWVASRLGLSLDDSGLADDPITLGAYGLGPRPRVVMSAGSIAGNQTGVLIAGSYWLLENVHVTLINPNRSPLGREPDGDNVALGWYVGFLVIGHHVTLLNCEVSHMALGVFLEEGTHHCKVLRPWVHDLDVLWRIDPPGAMGALGMLIHGSDQEVADGLFERNWAEAVRVADNSPQSYSAPFELYNCNDCDVHHNVALGHRKHAEFGHDAMSTCLRNRLAYNLFVSDRPRAVGPNIHGADPFGPVEDSLIEHNTVILTGEGSQALVSGGPRTIVRYNILQGVAKAIYLNNGTEYRNLYRGGLTQITGGLSPTSKKTDPLLDTNYRPKIGSPALRMALDGTSAGALEFWEDPMSDVLTELAAQSVALRVSIGAIRDGATIIASETSKLVTMADALDADIIRLAEIRSQLNEASSQLGP